MEAPVAMLTSAEPFSPILSGKVTAVAGNHDFEQVAGALWPDEPKAQIKNQSGRNPPRVGTNSRWWS